MGYKPVEHDEIIADDAFDPAIASGKRLLDLLNKLEAGFRSTLEASSKKFTLTDPKSLGELRAVQQACRDIEAAQKGITAVSKQQLIIQGQLNQLEIRANASKAETLQLGKTLASQTAELQSEEKKLLELRAKSNNPKAVEQLEKKLKDVRSEMNRVEQATKKVNDALSKTSVRKTGASSFDAPKETASQKGLTDAQKSQIETQIKLTKAKQDYRIQLKAEQSAYAALELEYHKAEQAAREIGAAQGETSVAFVEAADKANKLNDRLKAIDAGSGKYFRSVADYEKGTRGLAGAVDKLGKGLAGITGLLATVGNALGIDTEGLRNAAESSRELIKFTRELKHAQELSELGHVGNTAAIEAETVANDELAASELAINPIMGGVVLVLAAVGAALYRYRDQIFGVSDAEKEKRKADDGTLISDGKLRESYNESLRTVRDLRLEYGVLTGAISDYDAALQKINNRTGDEKTKLKKETKGKLEESILGEGAFDQLISATLNPLTGGLEQKRKTDELKSIVSDANNVIGGIDAAAAQEKANTTAAQNKKEVEQLRAKNDDITKLNADFIAGEVKREKAKAKIDYEIEKQSIMSSTDSITQKHKLIESLTTAHNLKMKLLDRQAVTESLTSQKEALDANVLTIQRAKGPDQQLTEPELTARVAVLKKQREIDLNNLDLTTGQKKKIEAQYLKDVNDLYIQYGEEKRKRINDLQDAEFAAIVSDFDKQVAQEKANLQRNLDAITGNTEEELKLKEQLIANSQKTLDDLTLDKDLKTAQQGTALRLLLAEKGSQEELDAKIADLEAQRAVEVAAAIRKGEDVALINAKFRKEEEDATKAFNKRINEERNQDIADAKLLELTTADAGNHKIFVAEKDAAKAKRDMLLAEEGLTNEKRRLIEDQYQAELKASRVKYLTGLVDQARTFEQQTFDLAKDRIDKEKELNATKIQEAETRVQRQEDLAQKGFANTLDFEKREQAKALEERAALEKREAKRKEAQQLAELFLTLFGEYAKSGGSAAAVGKATAQTLVAKAISEAIAGAFATGVENFQGKGTGTSDSNLIRFSAGESVITAEGTAQTPGLATALNTSGLEGAMQWFYDYAGVDRSDVSTAKGMTMPVVYMPAAQPDVNVTVHNTPAYVKDSTRLVNNYFTHYHQHDTSPDAARIALAKTLGHIPTAFTGMSDTGPAGTFDSQGGKLMVLHPHEGIANREGNEQNPGLIDAVNSKNPDAVKKWSANRFFTPKLTAPVMPQVSDKSPKQEIKEALGLMLDQHIKATQSLEQTIKNKREGEWFTNEIGEVMHRAKEAGITTETTYKRYPIIPRGR